MAAAPSTAMAPETALELAESAAAAEMAEYKVAVAALAERVAAAGPAPSPKKRRPKKRSLGLPPETGPMVWFATPVTRLAPPRVMVCSQPKGAIVRGGVEKSSGLVLKLAKGMEVVVDAEATATDGTPRVRLVDPVAGWASAKTLELVATATAVEEQPAARREPAVTPWASAAAPRRDVFDAHDGGALETPEAVAARLRVAGGHDCGGGGSGHASVPVFYLPGARTGPLAALPAGAAARRRPPAVEDVAGVPGAFFASDVLSPPQCAALVTLSRAMGLRVAELDKGDALRRNATQQCVFVDADAAVRSALNVVLPFAPARGTAAWMSAGSRTQNGAAPASAVPVPGALRGLNAKCRFLRYADGDSVQPHHDTAWQPCDVDAPDFGHGDDALSWLTAIVYLNDDFEGGETTFFVKRDGDDYGKVAVAPKLGACLLFFHGHHRASPLHEGSVARGATKHVLRTDVLFENAGRWEG